MASADNIEALQRAITQLIDALKVLTNSQDPMVVKIASSLLLRLTMALQEVAFGPNEWMAIDDDAVIAAIGFVNEAVEAASVEDPSVDDMIAVVMAVNAVIVQLEALN